MISVSHQNVYWGEALWSKYVILRDLMLNPTVGVAQMLHRQGESWFRSNQTNTVQSIFILSLSGETSYPLIQNLLTVPICTHFFTRWKLDKHTHDDACTKPLMHRHTLYNMFYYLWVSNLSAHLHDRSWLAFCKLHTLTLTGFLQTISTLSLLLVLLFLFIAGDVREETSMTNQSNYSNLIKWLILK
jgi:hypothetical protein